MASCVVSLTSRFRGALRGLAVGDAVGALPESCRPGTFTRIIDPAGLGRLGSIPGQWTDDTAMAMCLGDSAGASAFSTSHSGPCYGIGRTTRAALERSKDDASVPHAGLPTPDQAGNGGLMRVAPVAMAFALGVANGELLRVAPDSCRVTHGAPDAIDRTAAFALLLQGALAEVPRDTLLDPAYALVRAATPGWSPAEPELVGGVAYRAEGRGGTIIGSAYVAHSKAALWAAATADIYRDAVLAAINLGNDTGMMAAIAGALAGALWGEEAIPTPWLDALKWRNHIGRTGGGAAGSGARTGDRWCPSRGRRGRSSDWYGGGAGGRACMTWAANGDRHRGGVKA